jgi:hypothetical protein
MYQEFATKEDIRVSKHEILSEMRLLELRISTDKIYCEYNAISEAQKLKYEMRLGFSKMSSDLDKMGDTIILRLSGVMILLTFIAIIIQRLP